MVKLVWNGNCRCAVVPITDVMDYEPFNPEDFTSSDGLSNLMVGDIEPTNNGYNEYKEINKYYEREVTVREYEDGFKIMMEEGVDYTSMDEVKNYIDELPKSFIKQSRSEHIYLSNHYSGMGASNIKAAGEYIDKVHPFVVIYKIPKGYEYDVKGTLSHELGHSLETMVDKDYSKPLNERLKERFEYSNGKRWREAFKLDNKHNGVVNERTGRLRTVHNFVSDYARRVYKRRHKEKLHRFAEFSEDFADSWKLYLNPETHADFVNKFPNRTKILEEIINEEFKQ